MVQKATLALSRRYGLIHFSHNAIVTLCGQEITSRHLFLTDTNIVTDCSECNRIQKGEQ